MKKNDPREIYAQLCKLAEKVVPTCPNIRSEKGLLLTETAQILERWSQYCEVLYRENSTDEIKESAWLSSKFDIEQLPLVEETIRAVKSIHTNKACGSEQIPIELIQQGGEAVIANLHNLVNGLLATRMV
jgi:hypothetical protein